jgi:hypothetical protein
MGADLYLQLPLSDLLLDALLEAVFTKMNNG